MALRLLRAPAPLLLPPGWPGVPPHANTSSVPGRLPGTQKPHGILVLRPMIGLRRLVWLVAQLIGLLADRFLRCKQLYRRPAHLRKQRRRMSALGH